MASDGTLDAVPGIDYVYLLAAGVRSVALPTAVGNVSRYTARNISGGNSVLSAPAGQLIDGVAELVLADGAAVDVISDGLKWWAV